jgi:hypothetical protein
MAGALLIGQAAIAQVGGTGGSGGVGGFGNTPSGGTSGIAGTPGGFNGFDNRGTGVTSNASPGTIGTAQVPNSGQAAGSLSSGTVGGAAVGGTTLNGSASSCACPGLSGGSGAAGAAITDPTGTERLNAAAGGACSCDGQGNAMGDLSGQSAGTVEQPGMIDGIRPNDGSLPTGNTSGPGASGSPTNSVAPSSTGFDR